MRKVILFSVLLLMGLVASQILPLLVGDSYRAFEGSIRFLTMVGLSFIMIRVGFEFDIDKKNLGQYGKDYLVAFTAAAFPWVLVSGYFIFVLLPPDFYSSLDAWKEVLLAGRFASPTSAGVLFSMLAAAGLAGTWLFRKARTLAIFDDLDTVLLMVPLKMLMVGLAWQLGLIVLVMAVLLWLAYAFLHKVRLPATWPWVLGYGLAIATGSEVIYRFSKLVDESVPIHIEVLLPAFVLGCVLAYPKDHGFLDSEGERRASSVMAAVFMVLVGISMPLMFGGDTPLAQESLQAAGHPASEAEAKLLGATVRVGSVTASQPALPWKILLAHVLAVTLLANLGKMYVALCYRREADWRERLALAIGMWPRGEVGAGVLVISLSYGIGGPVVTVAMLSLSLNLVLTGVFILMVKKLVKH
jgi:Kef-type K+ transport system membrane component KefB